MNSMNTKKLLIFLILLSSLFLLFGCVDETEEDISSSESLSEYAMDYVSVCRGQDDLIFVVEATKGDWYSGEDLQGALSRAQKYFLTGLTIPNSKQWVNLFPESVAVEESFKQTEVAQIMLEQNIELKKAVSSLACETNIWPDARTEWDRLLSESPFYGELMSAGFDREPQGWWKVNIIGSPVKAYGNDCKAFVLNVELEAEANVLDLPVWIDFSGFDFRQEVSKDLQERLLQWKQWLQQALNERILSELKQTINNDKEFASIRELYPALALAQWHKKEIKENLPLIKFIDTEKIEGLEASVAFDEAYWLTQSEQALKSECGALAGVNLSGFDLRIEGSLTQEMQGKLDKTVYESLPVPLNKGEKILFGDVLKPDLPDLVPHFVLIGSKQLLRNEETQIEYLVKNVGKASSDSFAIYLYSKHTHPSGYTSTFRVAQETVNGLAINGSARGIIPFSTDKAGTHRLFFEVDYGNAVEEISEVNNLESFEFEVVKQMPAALIVKPDSKIEIISGDELRFFGKGSDVQDGELVGDSLIWSSSLQGEIGRGQEFTLTNLVPGVHLITLTVIDSNGFKDQDQTSAVVEGTEPEAKINVPRGFALLKSGGPVMFEGISEDKKDSRLSGNSLKWESSLDGVLGFGEKITVEVLSRGTHTITLTATDSENFVGVDDIEISVVDMEEIKLNTFDDGSTEKILEFREEYEMGEYVFLTFKKNAMVATATLDVTGLSASEDSNQFPVNPMMMMETGDIVGDVWRHEGEFTGTETTPNFAYSLEAFDMEQCSGGSEYCSVPLWFYSDTPGKLKLSNLNVEYIHLDAFPPSIVDASPDSAFVGDSLTLTAKVFDNQGVESVKATLLGQEITLQLQEENQFFNVYSAPLPELDAGEYLITIKAVDVGGLIEEYKLPLIVDSRKAELFIDSKDVFFLPRRTWDKGEEVTVGVFVRNIGLLDAENFELQLLVDDVVSEWSIISIPAKNKQLIKLYWTADVGEHSLRVKADANNSIIEDNENNNEVEKQITIIDVFSPKAPIVSASPRDWSNSVIRVVSWDPLEDGSGIERYEYRIDSEEWRDNGLNTSFITEPQSEGMHTVSVRAIDKAGNIGEEGNTKLFIDLSPPNTPMLKELHSGSDWSSHDSPYFVWTNPGDLGAGIVEYTVLSRDLVIGITSDENYHPTLKTGIYYIKVNAIDALRQRSNRSNEIIIKIDTEMPESVVVSSPTHPNESKSYQDNILVFEWAVPRDKSGIAGYYYWVDGVIDTVPSPETVAFFTEQNTVTIDSIPKGFNFAEMQEGLSKGIWYFHIRAKDSAGNIGKTSHFRVNIN